MVTKPRHRDTIFLCSKQSRQCSDLPSYWIRQIRRTQASNPGALTERKTKETKKQRRKYNMKIQYQICSHVIIPTPPYILVSFWSLEKDEYLAMPHGHASKLNSELLADMMLRPHWAQRADLAPVTCRRPALPPALTLSQLRPSSHTSVPSRSK